MLMTSGSEGQTLMMITHVHFSTCSTCFIQKPIVARCGNLSSHYVIVSDGSWSILKSNKGPFDGLMVQFRLCARFIEDVCIPFDLGPFYKLLTTQHSIALGSNSPSHVALSHVF